MANTYIKAGQFSGVIGNGTSGYFLISNGDGTMSWISNIINPTITNVDYPGVATAADPVGGESITLTGTGFKTGATVTIGGAAAPAVSYVSATQITFTTPAKAAGDYDIVVTNTDTGSATYINGISYNGIPTWTTAAGSLGTFASNTTISTITLQATEPDAGTITFNITNGALPTGLSLTGANIDGTTSILNADTLYTFTVTATDNESQATPRTFTITVLKEFVSSENFTINTYTGNGSTRAIEGKIGTAASFNGSSSYITTSLKSQNVGTFSFWFKGATPSSSVTLFNNNDVSSNEKGIMLQGQTNGTFRVYIAQGNGVAALDIYTTNTFFDNSWHNVVLTWNLNLSGTNTYLYVDGVVEVSGASNTGVWTSGQDSTYNFFIGAGRTNLQFFNGLMDQVRIFNTALDQTKVTTLYGENNASSTKSTTDIFDDGSGVALYEFEKGAIDTGGVYSGTPTNVGFVGTSFQPDLVWIKSRSTNYDHQIHDSIRGAGFGLLTNDLIAEINYGTVTSFDSNGFTVDASSYIGTNANNQTFAAWCWKAGGAAVSNTDGILTSQVSANQAAGFSIVKYTGNLGNATIGHGLDEAPELVIYKSINNSRNWIVQAEARTNTSNYLHLNLTDAYANYPNYFHTTTNETIGIQVGDPTANGNEDYIAYCFHSVAGYQKVGSYTGGGLTKRVYTTDDGTSSGTGGFKPRFVMIKATSSLGGAQTYASWAMYDSLRNIESTDRVTDPLFANTSYQEGLRGDGSAGSAVLDLTFNNDGFTIEHNGYEANAPGASYIYLAIA